MHPVLRKIFLAVALAHLPVSSMAASGETLETIDSMKEMIDWEQTDYIEESADAAIDALPDLFPVPEDVEDLRGERRSDISVVVLIDGDYVTFADVQTHHWFAPYVAWALSGGILSGYRDAAGKPLGLFGPADNVTVEQLAKIAVNIARKDETLCAHGRPWNTSAQSRWSQLFVSCAESNGWTLFRDTSMNITRSATRGEVIGTILQAAGAARHTAKGGVFSDVSLSHPWAAFVEQASSLGIVSGYKDSAGALTGRFGPDDPVRRAELAKMLMEAVRRVGT